MYYITHIYGGSIWNSILISREELKKLIEAKLISKEDTPSNPESTPDIFVTAKVCHKCAKLLFGKPSSLFPT